MLQSNADWRGKRTKGQTAGPGRPGIPRSPLWPGRPTMPLCPVVPAGPGGPSGPLTKYTDNLDPIHPTKEQPSKHVNKPAHSEISLPWGHPLQSLLCLLGFLVVLQVHALLVFQGAHDLLSDQEGLLFLELPEAQVLQPDPIKRGFTLISICDYMQLKKMFCLHF